MSVNLLPKGGESSAVQGVDARDMEGVALLEKIGRARLVGYRGILLDCQGTPNSLYAPSVGQEYRDQFFEATKRFDEVALVAPTFESMQIALLSPSSAVRRAGLAEIWSVCRFAQSLGRAGRKAVVLVEVASPPQWLNNYMDYQEILRVSLSVLNRTAAEQGCLIALWNRGAFSDLADFGVLELMPSENLRIALDMTSPIDSDAFAAIQRWGTARFAHIRAHERDAFRNFAGMVCKVSPNE